MSSHEERKLCLLYPSGSLARPFCARTLASALEGIATEEELATWVPTPTRVEEAVYPAVLSLVESLPATAPIWRKYINLSTKLLIWLNREQLWSLCISEDSNTATRSNVEVSIGDECDWDCTEYRAADTIVCPVFFRASDWFSRDRSDRILETCCSCWREVSKSIKVELLLLLATVVVSRDCNRAAETSADEEAPEGFLLQLLLVVRLVVMELRVCANCSTCFELLIYGVGVG